MRVLLSIILTGFFFNASFGQQENYNDVPDLLQKLAGTSSDTAAIMLKSQVAEAFRSNKPDTSLLLATEALVASRKINFKKGEVRALIVFAVLHRERGDLSLALDAGLKAIKIADEHNLIYEQVFANLRVAIVYLAINDANKAITYLKNADGLLINNYDEFQWIVIQYFFGEAYYQLNDFDAAEKQALIVEKYRKDELAFKTMSRRMRAHIAVKRNNLPLAIQFYRESYEAGLAESEIREVATTSNAMALAFQRMGQFDSAVHYARQGLKFGEMLAYKNRILAASSLLAELYSVKDPAEAVKYYKIASAARDSLYGLQKVSQLQAATIKEQERQAEQEALKIAYQNRVKQWALIGGLVVFLGIVFILYLNNRQKQNANKVLEKTLQNLKTTQSQLIQSEKMASLGELTAGIAHEIQNPLNFVNNFSELSHELLEELKEEIENKNYNEVKIIADDVKNNLTKILHHGKRADAIVKGMLQHSRNSSGKKEATDINALADEYLRLAYHGLRAKDNSFNATLKTDYDNSIGNINIVPQDVGRVILNLITNAFYAVNERSLKERTIGDNTYEPTVTVITKKSADSVQIIVKDNGGGIPQKVMDKIFQPFFTTKPTGEGTGLGLSLSYDIVKAHGGELKVVTNEGEGSEFIIQIPFL